MKKIIRLTIALVCAIAMPQTSNAQLTNLLKGAASSAVNTAVNTATGNNAAGEALGGILSNILGTGNVSKNNIVGTWTYSEPCIVAESENILTNMAVASAAKKASSYLNTATTKAGFTAGQVTLVLNEDGSAHITSHGKTINGTWTVKGSDLTLTNTLTQKSITMNAKMEDHKLQLSVKSDKLLTLLQTFGSTATTNTTLTTVNTMLRKVNGLYVGLMFSK